MSDISIRVREFYERFSFPGYEGINTPTSLIRRMKYNLYAQLLDEQIPFCARVLDMGCGTGQLAIFLALRGRVVTACDFSKTSIEKALEFQKKYNIKNLQFINDDLFKISFPEETFDYILCNGVLHHTPEPYAGFKRLCTWLKSEGYISIGLYNRWARKILQLRRFFGKLNNKFITLFDSQFRRKDLDNSSKMIWLMDQYYNPHESTHTIDEVLFWFKMNNIQYCSSIPNIKIFYNIQNEHKLFVINHPGGKIQHYLKQMLWMFTGTNEGGYFIMIGKKLNA